MEVGDNLKSASAVIRGYILGRTKKGKTALRQAMRMSGKSLRPTDLARAGAVQLARSPGVERLVEQVRGPLLEAAKQAVVTAVEAQANALSVALDKRIQALGAVTEGVSGVGEAAGKVTKGVTEGVAGVGEAAGKVTEGVTGAIKGRAEEPAEPEKARVPEQARGERGEQAERPEGAEAEEEPVDSERSPAAAGRQPAPRG
jgi:hypothetical protein